MTTVIQSICLLGFGEVGQILAADLLASGRNPTSIRVFDKQFADPDSSVSRALAFHPSVQPVFAAADAALGCQLVISAVTAGQAQVAAESVLRRLAPEAYFLEMNSISPGTKISIAEKVAMAGGRFVEASVMSPIEPKRRASPIILGGPYAEEFLPLGLELGFTGMQLYANSLGRVAATKMCRSLMIKGMETLLAESLLAARLYGVEREVLASLNNLLPMADWSGHANYMISRSLKHGVRRAEEMREVARTVAEAGVAPYMSWGCVESQEWVAQFTEARDSADLNTMLDTIIGRLRDQTP